MKTTTHYRWRMLALLFAATTINYIDRSLIGVLAPTLQEHIFHWTNQQYSYITMAFKLSYLVGLLAIGAFIDKVGTKIGFAVSIAIWSIFGMLHSAVTVSMGWIGFAIVRLGLGLGESGNFPACIKTVAEWFPKKERALATGIFNAGANIGAMLAPLIVYFIISENGKNWQYVFLVTGTLSLIWLLVWLKSYKKPEKHPKIAKDELEHILSDNVIENEEKLSWKKVLPLKETWAFALAKIPDAVWWFYIFWGSAFLYAKFGVKISGLVQAMLIIYILADVGSVTGGWLSSFLIKKGWSVNRSRKTTMFICSMLILPVIFATQTNNQWIAICLIGLAAAGHQAWSANAFTLVSDVFPKKATASVVGIGGMVGVSAGIIADLFLGRVLDKSGPSAYFWAFLIGGCVYIIMLAGIHLLIPKMTPVKEEKLY
jgi:ACS family hexuronate transporter-like MFS transporter